MAVHFTGALRIRAEFGFLFNSITPEGTFADGSPEVLSRMEWCKSIWQVLSERNSYPQADRQADTEELEVGDVKGSEPEVVAAIIKPQTDTAEQKGDQLEEAVARLFRVFFQIGDDLPWKIRQQKRGTQGG
ncbi:MAG TPA: hypothetical protein VLJ61_05780 [Pyrinomonadaceae bacterium]|nr:hypothetical protein [Pyrinomonadaceae bacterium]